MKILGLAGKLVGVRGSGSPGLPSWANRQEPAPNRKRRVDERPTSARRSCPSREVPAVIGVASPRMHQGIRTEPAPPPEKGTEPIRLVEIATVIDDPLTPPSFTASLASGSVGTSYTTPGGSKGMKYGQWLDFAARPASITCAGASDSEHEIGGGRRGTRTHEPLACQADA